MITGTECVMEEYKERERRGGGILHILDLYVKSDLHI